MDFFDHVTSLACISRLPRVNLCSRQVFDFANRTLGYQSRAANLSTWRIKIVTVCLQIILKGDPLPKPSSTVHLLSS